MKHQPIRHALSALVSLATVLGAGAAQAQDYPNKPVRIIAPFAAGTGPDVNAREIAAKLAPILGQPVIVENRDRKSVV